MSGLADRIRIRYDETEEISRQFGSLSDDVAMRLHALRRQLNVLEDGAWIGAGATRFYDEMDLDILPAVQRLAEALQATSEVLRVASQQFREADEGTSRLFIDFQAGEFTDSGREGFFERVFEIARARYNLGDAIGLINNALGIARELKLIPRAVEEVMKLVEAGYGAQNLGQLLEQLAEGGTQVIIERTITLLPSAVNDVNQLVGKVAVGFAALLNDFIPDPQLGEAIARFDVTLENADSGNVTGSFSTVAVDVGQLNLEGYIRHPTLSRLLSFGGPLTSVVIGAFSNPELTRELARDSLTFAGSVADFGVGIAGMHDAYVDLTSNTARVITHSAGEFAGFPPALNDRLSSFVGGAAGTVSSFGFGSAGPNSDSVNRLLEAVGIQSSGPPDFSTWLGNLVPN